MTAARASDFRNIGGGAVENEVWLLGQPRLRQYLDYVRDFTPGGAGAKQSALVDEWRSANDRYHELEQSESGLADRVEIYDLDTNMQKLAAAVAADPRYDRLVGGLPARIALVELDKLVVPQPHVNLSHVERLRARLAPDLSSEALFHFCLPLDRAEAPVHMRRTGARRYTFWSDSSDFRFHEAAVFSAGQVGDFEPMGPLGGIVGLMVGFGSNFLTAIESDTRLLLHNGHHRAYALRAAGVTHAPCLIQTVTRRDELDLIASRDIIESAAFYFKADRPPVLADFFDPKLRKEHLVYKSQRMVELSFEVRDFEVRDLSTLS